MTIRILSIVGIVTASLVGRPAPAANCQDIPLRVTLYNNAVIDGDPPTTTPSAIRSDGLGEYPAGIRVCGGTFDAVTNVPKSRSFTYTFPAPIAGSVIDAVPTWVPGTFAGSGWINVRNILFNKGLNQPFATMAGSTFTRSGDRFTYILGFKGSAPDLPNAPNLHDPNNTPGANTPFPSSPVVVYPNYPIPCGPGSMPHWLVRATSANYPQTTLEVATLHKTVSNSQPAVHEGQYSMPFELLLEAQKCFSY